MKDVSDQAEHTSAGDNQNTEAVVFSASILPENTSDGSEAHTALAITPMADEFHDIQDKTPNKDSSFGELERTLSEEIPQPGGASNTEPAVIPVPLSVQSTRIETRGQMPTSGKILLNAVNLS